MRDAVRVPLRPSVRARVAVAHTGRAAAAVVHDIRMHRSRSHHHTGPPAATRARREAAWGDAIRDRRDEIQRAWSRDERFVSAPEAVRLLDDVIERAIALDAGRTPSRPIRAIAPGLDIRHLVGHHAALRDVIANVVERELPAPSRLRALRALGRAIDDAVAAVMEEHDNAVEESARHRAAELQFLADATAALSSSLDYDRTLDQVARLAAQSLADWCVVDVVEPDGRLRRVCVAHRDPDVAELAREVATTSEPSGGVAHVIRTGQPEVAHPGGDPRATEPRHVETLRSLGLSSYLVASYAIVPMSTGERTLGAFTLVSGSSQRRYDEGDLALATEVARRAALAVENARSYAAAREAIRARDRLITIVAHDLRNPLSAIGILATLLRERHERDVETARDLETIGHAIDRMKHMIADLLDMSRIEAGRFSLEREPTRVTALIDGVIATYEALAIERGILLRAGAVSDATVSCDPARIDQVLDNLVGNALKFCRRDDTVTLGVQLDGTRARFQVADTGPGIAPDDLPHIFEMFWSTGTGGIGIGLHVSKRIVEAHGGQIWAESRPGRGTTVSFTLPLAEGGAG